MDPTENLREQLQLAHDIIEGRVGIMGAEKGERLAELVLALDGWLAGGGFLPAQWRFLKGAAQ